MNSFAGFTGDESLTRYYRDVDRAGGPLAAAAAGAAVSRHGDGTAAECHRRRDSDDRRKSVGGEGDGLRRGNRISDREAWSDRTDDGWSQSHCSWSVSGRRNVD